MCHGFLQCCAYGVVAATRAEAYILIGFIILWNHNLQIFKFSNLQIFKLQIVNIVNYLLHLERLCCHLVVLQQRYVRYL